MSLEVCIDSLESAKKAIEGGVDRLEVCSALSLSGLTPTVGLVRAIKEISDVPLFCMIRSSPGDFVPTQDEIDTMRFDMMILKEAGANGFVFGFTRNNSLDVKLCRAFLRLADGLPCTLHRAFDVVEDWEVALEQAVDIGFQTILTSGQEKTALEGLEKIKAMQRKAAGRIIIMAGSGVSSATIGNLLNSGCTWYHGSAAGTVHKVESDQLQRTGMGCGGVRRITSAKEVGTLKSLLYCHQLVDQ